MVFQHDGCPAHYQLQVRHYLNEQYPGRPDMNETYGTTSYGAF